MIQGLSLGGEYGSSATYLSEMAGRERRGFWSSFRYVTLIAGQLVALALLLLLQSVMPEAALEAWGWRLAFLAGALLAVVVFIIRRDGSGRGVHQPGRLPPRRPCALPDRPSETDFTISHHYLRAANMPLASKMITARSRAAIRPKKNRRFSADGSATFLLRQAT
jgi:MFS family permease